jgi:hypothetical protein
LADTHVLTDFSALLSNDSRHRRANDGVAEIQLRLGQLSTALVDLRIRGVRLGPPQGYLLRRGLRAAQIGLGLQEFPFRLTHGLLDGQQCGSR